jgi:two-component system response regulator AtoC
MGPTPKKYHLLIIDDEENMRHMLGRLLARSGYVIEVASNGYDGLQKILHKHYDFVLCDIKMPVMDGIEFLKNILKENIAVTIIMMSAYGTIDTAISAMKLGAYDYISKPFKPDEVLLALRKAEEREFLKKENNFLKERIKTIESDYGFKGIIGKSEAIQKILEMTAKVAQYNTTVLITGESGTGKELIAKAIHANSQRADKPLISINCGGIPENLLETELFGHVKGAFTGADRDKIGLFKEAHKGTLFLDEIGELPLHLQVKLLRVLQENEIRPVGSSKTYPIDVRVIAATAKDLSKQVAAGHFREDLFYRLNVMALTLPPLRERAQDIPLLCDFFIEKHNANLGKKISSIATDALDTLIRYEWPGNIRELENTIERAMVLSEEDIIQKPMIPFSSKGGNCQEKVKDMKTGYSLKVAQKKLEREMISKALQATNGNRTKAAQMLEISHPSLLSKIKMYDISA